MSPKPIARLEKADQQRIRSYLQQEEVLQTIASETGYTAAQVRNFLRRLNNPPTAREVEPYPPQVAITQAQYFVIRRCQQTGLNPQVLAKRLTVDATILTLELAGLKTMSSQRMQLLNDVCIAENC
jgi:hypothetical protein